MDGFDGRLSDAAVLDRAKEILRVGGHCKMHFHKDTERCILGAVAEAKFGSFNDHYKLDENSPRLADAIAIEAKRVLEEAKAPGAREYAHTSDYYLACSVNNMEDMDREKAIGFLDAVKARLAGGAVNAQ